MKLLAYAPFALATIALSADSCCESHCLGPTNYGINAPTIPYTCDGDFEVTVAGLYWKAQESGLEYAISTKTPQDFADGQAQLIDGQFYAPHFDWDFGFKIGLGYNSACDGWSFSGLWTRFETDSTTRVQAENENVTILTLWSDEAGANTANPLFARDIKTDWHLKLNFFDLTIGRSYWNSPKVSLQPQFGLRLSYLNQDFHIFHIGGVVTDSPSPIPDLNNEVELNNDFHAAGPLGGVAGNWHLGCGFSLYGDFAFSLNWGRFDVDHTEFNREAFSPFSKTRIMEASDSFRATRLYSDLGLGIRYFTLFSDCQYAFAASLGWEQHYIANFNQLWRVYRLRDGVAALQNIFSPSNGDLSIQGFTLKVVFDF